MPRSAVSEALIRVNRIKAPTKRAQAIVDAVLGFETQAQAADFVAVLRRRANVQDLSLIQGDVWKIDTLKGDWKAGDADFTRQDVLNLTSRPGASQVEIRFPDLFQYGTVVFFTLGTTRYRAHTPDWGPSETYLSM
jgi:hypothetical protein